MEKAYEIFKDYGCPTASACLWSLKRDEFANPVTYKAPWDPYQDTCYEHGGNTWRAHGALTNQSVEQYKNLWAQARGAKKNLHDVHVIGEFLFRVYADTIVDEELLELFDRVAPGALSYSPVETIWDSRAGKKAWNKPAFMASINVLLPSFDIELSDIGLTGHDVSPKYNEKHVITGSSRKIRRSVVEGHHLWRDQYTRMVFCSERLW